MTIRRLTIICVLCLVTTLALAQRITRRYDNVSMSKALMELNDLQREYVVNFIYDELEDFRVTTHIQNKPISDAILQIVGFYPVRVVKSGKNEIYLECTHKTDHHLTGTIIDEQGHPIAYANIAVLNPEDSVLLSGGVSNEAGQFVVPYEQHKVLARISFIGYKTVYRLCTQENMGTIQLQRESYMIKGIEAKGSVPQYKMTRGGVEVNVANTLLSKMGNAFDVLSELPRVDVSNETVTVFSKGTPDIYINNKKVHDQSELRGLKSTDIKTVEVITRPGVQYSASIGAVIRIKTIRRQNEGVSFSSVSRINYNSGFGGNQVVQVSYSQGKWETFGQVTYYNSVHKEKDELYAEITTPQEQITTEQTAWIHGRTHLANIRAGFNYEPSGNHSLGAIYSIAKSTSDYDWEGSQKVYQDGIQIGVVNQNNNLPMNMGPQHILDVYYTGKAGKFSINFDGSYLWRKDTRDNYMKETSEELEDRTVNTSSNNHNSLIAGKLVLSHPIGKGMLSFGSEASHTKTQSLYYSDFDQIPSSDNTIHEEQLSLFVEYALTLGKQWRIGAGLRYEHEQNEYELYGKHLDASSRTYDDLFPNISIIWHKGKNGAELSYNKRISRPPYSALTRSLQYDSRYMYESGNPLLHPQFNQTVSLALSHSWLSFEAEYSYSKDNIMQLTGLYNGQAISLKRHENISHYQVVNASMVAAPKFGWYQPQYTLTYLQQFFDGKPYGITHDLNKPLLGLRLQNRFVLGKTAFISLFINGSTGYGSETTEQKPRAYANLSFYKSFFKKALSLNIQFNDIFYTNRERWSGYGDCVYTSKDAWMNTRSLSITLTYNFNQKRSKYKGTGAGNDEKNRL